MTESGLTLRSLVFDDDEAVRGLLVQILESRGVEVFSFPRPALCRECRCRAGEACADVIISDVSMPRHTGVEFLEHQACRGCRVQHVALMSGDWSESDLRRARELGCRVFRKPLDFPEVEAWLDECAKSIDCTRSLAPWFHERTWPDAGLDADCESRA